MNQFNFGFSKYGHDTLEKVVGDCDGNNLIDKINLENLSNFLEKEEFCKIKENDYLTKDK